MKLPWIGKGIKQGLRNLVVPFAEYDDLQSYASGDEGSSEFDASVPESAPSASTTFQYKELQADVISFRVLTLNPSGNKLF